MKAQGQNWKSKLFKASIMVMGAAMTMGNQKCEQKPVASERNLKKLVDLGAIKSAKIYLPNGSFFDFQFVANQQIYSVLMDSDQFAFKTSPPISSDPTTVANGDLSFLNLSAVDRQIMKSSSQAVGKDNYSLQYSKTAWCLVNVPQAKIEGAVNAFELVGGGGLKLGFNSAGAHSGNGISGLGFDVSFAQMDLSMRALYPLTSKVMAATNVNSTQTKTSVNFTLNLGALAIGPSAYYETPVAKVTLNGLKKAVDALSTKMKTEEWYTRVMADHDTHVVIVGGKDVGIEEGDEFLIYNEEHYWDGEPCNSNYKSGLASVNSAVAKIRIDTVGGEISRGLVIEQNDFKPEVGAKVTLFQFHASDYTGAQPGVDDGTVISSGPSSGSTKVGRK